MKEKASRKLANGQNIDYSEKENGPRASSAPALGLNSIIFKHVYWYMLQISGERLQDHWSSGCYTSYSAAMVKLRRDLGLKSHPMISMGKASRQGTRGLNHLSY